MNDTLLVPARYCGPATSGNGGYVAGSLAHEFGDTFGRDRDGHVPPTAAARRDDARQPGGRTAHAHLRGCLVAQAELTDTEVEPVEGVSWDAAVAASPSYPGHRSHPFPQCFVCGTERDDGLRIFPGEVPAVGGDTRLAAPWVPDHTLAADYHEYDDPAPRACLPATWSALDCVGGWAGDFSERLMVLGRMTAVVDTLPVIGEAHVVTGERRGSEGRKTFTASTLHDSDGRIVGRAEHTWVAVDPAMFGG